MTLSCFVRRMMMTMCRSALILEDKEKMDVGNEKGGRKTD